MKFDETIDDVMKAMKDAEVHLVYYVVNPDKNHPSALDGKIYLKRDDAIKAAKKLKADWDVWPGMQGRGVRPYDIPKKYKVIK